MNLKLAVSLAYLTASFKNTRKIAALWAAFSSSFGGLQPLAATVVGGALQAHLYVFLRNKNSCGNLFWREFFFLQKNNS